MAQLTAKFKFTDLDGKLQEGEISEETYKEASDVSLSVSQLLARKYPTDATKYGSILSQALSSKGLVLKPNAELGLYPTRMSEVFNGVKTFAGAITSPDGDGNTTPAGRLFFPEVILQTIASALRENKGDFFAGYESLLSGTDAVNAPEFKRAIIDETAPEDSESMSTAQLAEPPAMVSITAANRTTPIPSKAIGLVISDQAIQTAAFDLVNLVMSRQAYGERVRMVNNNLSDVLNGNSDLGMSALSVAYVDTLDAAIVTDGAITQKAWVHYLRDNYEKMTITNIICTIDTALAIENRTNKPIYSGDDPRSPRIDTLFSIDNLGLTPPRVFLVDSSVVPDDRIVGLDNNWALRRVVNVSASYEAIESFLMRRAKAFRVDHGESLYRLYDDAFSLIDLATTP
ncbi:MAG: hypothetical protein PVI43_00055 [Candidatus Bathyarchaeota archaeon]|jgi:hypothetical protein